MKTKNSKKQNKKNLSATRKSSAKKTVETGNPVANAVAQVVNSNSLVGKIAASLIACSISVSKYGGEKTDKKITSETNTSHGVSQNKGVYKLKLMQSDELANVSAYVQQVYLFFKSLSFSTGKGMGNVPVAQYITFSQKLGNMKREFMEKVETFISAYDEILERDRLAMTQETFDANGQKVIKTAFDRSNYPSKDELKARFSFNFSARPISGEDSAKQLGLPSEAIAQIEATMEQDAQEFVKQGKRELLSRILFGNQDSANEGLGNGLIYWISLVKSEKNFRQSTMDNLKAQCEAVCTLAESIGASDIVDAARKVSNVLGESNADSIKDNTTVRDSVLEKAENAINEIKMAMAAFC